MSLPGFDMADVFAGMVTGTYRVHRRSPDVMDGTPGSPTYGQRISGPVTYEMVAAFVYPEPSLSNDEVPLPQGNISDDRIMVLAHGLANPFEASSPTKKADRIEWNGKLYEVTDTLDWSEIGGFCQARFGVVGTKAEGNP